MAANVFNGGWLNLKDGGYEAKKSIKTSDEKVNCCIEKVDDCEVQYWEAKYKLQHFKTDPLARARAMQASERIILYYSML